MDQTTRSNSPSTFGTSKNTEGTVGKASSSAHAAVDTVASAAEAGVRKAKPAIDSVATGAHQAADQAARVAGPASDWVAKQGESLKATQEKVLEETSNYVSSNPLKAVGLALAAGFVLARILR